MRWKTVSAARALRAGNRRSRGDRRSTVSRSDGPALVERLRKVMGIGSDTMSFFGTGGQIIHIIVQSVAPRGRGVAPRPQLCNVQRVRAARGIALCRVLLNPTFTIDTPSFLRPGPTRPRWCYCLYPTSTAIFSREEVIGRIAAEAPGLVVIDELQPLRAQDLH